MKNDFTEGHLRTTAPTKFRRLYESALRATEAMGEHIKVIAEVGKDPLTGRGHSQGCWAGGLRWGSSDMTGEMCWCGLQRQPEAPPEMRVELFEMLNLQSTPVNNDDEEARRRAVEMRAAAFLAKWGVVLAGEMHLGTVK